MNEELLTDDLFDFDETVEEVDEVEEEIETEEEEEEIVDTPVDDEPTNEPSEDEPYMTIRYNHEDKPLTREEAVTMAQKGMNYDNLNNRYTQLNGELEDLARMNGMDVNTYLQSLRGMQENIAINREMQTLREQYPDTHEDLLKEIAEKRVAEARQNQQANEQKNQNQEADARRNEIQRQLDVFQRKYPNLDPQNLDQQVYDLMSQGYTMLEAYNEWRDAQAHVQAQAQAQKEAVKKANEANSKKKLGNVGNVGKVEKDIFLSEFLSD